MQPTLRQVPPSVGRFSTHAVCQLTLETPAFNIAVTFSPSWAALMAATYPPGPAPMTKTSNLPANARISKDTAECALLDEEDSILLERREE